MVFIRTGCFAFVSYILKANVKFPSPSKVIRNWKGSANLGFLELNQFDFHGDVAYITTALSPLFN